MANLKVKNGSGTDAYLKASGAGTDGDPLIPQHTETSAAAILAALGGTLTVDGTVTATGPLTDTQLRATPVPVSGTVTATTGGLTDAQLRASAVPVSGTVTATGPLTDTQLRAAAVPTSDSGPSWTQVFGVSGAVFTSADASTATAVTDAPTAGQKLVIDDIIFSVGSTAMQVDFQIETAATKFLTFYCAANTQMQITPRGKLKLPTADKKLMVKASVAGSVSVTVFYHSEA